MEIKTGIEAYEAGEMICPAVSEHYSVSPAGEREDAAYVEKLGLKKNTISVLCSHEWQGM